MVKVDGSDLTAEAVREFLAPRVAKWQVPDHVVFIDEVPKTSVGKFRKIALREQFASHPEQAQPAETQPA